VLTAACYWLSSHCITAEKFVILSVVLSQKHSMRVLDSDKGVCYHHSSTSTSVVPNQGCSHPSVVLEVSIIMTEIDLFIILLQLFFCCNVDKSARFVQTYVS